MAAEAYASVLPKGFPKPRVPADYLASRHCAAIRAFAMFASAFPGETDPITIRNVTRSIASFERALVSADSPYDRYHYGGDDGAVSESNFKAPTPRNIALTGRYMHDGSVATLDAVLDHTARAPGRTTIPTRIP